MFNFSHKNVGISNVYKHAEGSDKELKTFTIILVSGLLSIEFRDTENAERSSSESILNLRTQNERISWSVITLLVYIVIPFLLF